MTSRRKNALSKTVWTCFEPVLNRFLTGFKLVLTGLKVVLNQGGQGDLGGKDNFAQNFQTFTKSGVIGPRSNRSKMMKKGGREPSSDHAAGGW